MHRHGGHNAIGAGKSDVVRYARNVAGREHIRHTGHLHLIDLDHRTKWTGLNCAPDLLGYDAVEMMVRTNEQSIELARPAIGEMDFRQVAALTGQTLDGNRLDADSPLRKRLGIRRFEIATIKIKRCRPPLGDEHGLMTRHGRDVQHSELLAAELVAVTVGAMDDR